MTAWALRCAEGLIPVRLRRAQRRTIALHLRPGPYLELRAPSSLGDGELWAFLDSRRGWVERRLPELPEPTPAPTFTEGEICRFLGEPLRLRLGQASRVSCIANGHQLHVTLPQPERPDRVASALRAWYRRQAETIFSERLDVWRQRLAAWRLPEPSLRLRRMRRRWGSCSNTGTVTLNTHLVERATPLIDHVVVHELCHLVELNHSVRFYALMDVALPNWRDCARALDAGQYALPGPGRRKTPPSQCGGCP